MSTAELLKSCSLFRGFSDAGLIVIGKIAHVRKFPAKTPIFVENMVAESLFVVRTGVVQLSIKSNDGPECVLERLVPGDTFGEMSLLIKGHRLVTASADTDCELFEITKRDFAKLQKQKPQTCLKLMINAIGHFSKRLISASEHLKPLIESQIHE